MANRKEFQFESNNPWGLLLGLIIFVLGLIGLFWLAQFVFRILFYLSPFLLLGSIFLDRGVILGYIRLLSNLLRRNALVGILAIALSVIGFPVVSAYLFLRALIRWRLRKEKQMNDRRTSGEYVSFEELPEQQEFPLPDEPEEDWDEGRKQSR